MLLLLRHHSRTSSSSSRPAVNQTLLQQQQQPLQVGHAVVLRAPLEARQAAVQTLQSNFRDFLGRQVNLGFLVGTGQR
jgi:hypothetical protein